MSPSRLLWIASALGILFIFLATAGLVNSKPKNRILSSDAAWSWFQDPRAIYDAGQTFFSGNNRDGDAVVYSYDHSTGQINMSKPRQGLEYDDHAAPSLQVKPDGRIVAWYSAHGGEKLYYRISCKPGDISCWGSERYLPFGYSNEPGTYGYTYPNPVYLSSEKGGTTYLLWRFKGQNPYIASTKDFVRWSPARRLFESGFRPYVKVVGNEKDTIHFSVTDGHPLDVKANSIYHFYYRGGNFYKSDGTFIRKMAQIDTNPLKPSEVTKVYDAKQSRHGSWVWDIALDNDGKPVITYAEFVNVHNHHYHYAKWNGTKWVDQKLTSAGGSFEESGNDPYYSGGVVLDHEDTNIVYLSKQADTDRWDIQKRHWNGSSWDTVTLTSGGKNVRPLVPRNHAAGLDVIWMYGDYPSFTSFKTQYRTYP